MKLITRLTLATSCALIATLYHNSASAAIINYAFKVDSPVTQGSGAFSFDDSAFNNPTTGSVPVTSLNFKFDGDPIYTEKDDVDYPDFPSVFPTTILTGQKTFELQYLFPKQPTNPSTYYEIDGQDFAILSEFNPRNQIGSGTVTYQQVPEHTALGGTLLAFSIGWLMKRKQSNR